MNSQHHAIDWWNIAKPALFDQVRSHMISWFELPIEAREAALRAAAGWCDRLILITRMAEQKGEDMSPDEYLHLVTAWTSDYYSRVHAFFYSLTLADEVAGRLKEGASQQYYSRWASFVPGLVFEAAAEFLKRNWEDALCGKYKSGPFSDPVFYGVISKAIGELPDSYRQQSAISDANCQSLLRASLLIGFIDVFENQAKSFVSGAIAFSRLLTPASTQELALQALAMWAFSGGRGWAVSTR
jgi:hypothetical protein